jgi:hypothetical protein
MQPTDNEDNMKLKITVEALDPVTQSGLEFFAGRAGQTIEEYCCEAISAGPANETLIGAGGARMTVKSFMKEQG